MLDEAEALFVAGVTCFQLQGQMGQPVYTGTPARTAIAVHRRIRSFSPRTRSVWITFAGSRPRGTYRPGQPRPNPASGSRVRALISSTR